MCSDGLVRIGKKIVLITVVVDAVFGLFLVIDGLVIGSTLCACAPVRVDKPPMAVDEYSVPFTVMAVFIYFIPDFVRGAF